MSLDGLRVNHAGLDTAAHDLSRAVQQIDDRLNRLESELARMDIDGMTPIEAIQKLYELRAAARGALEGPRK